MLELESLTGEYGRDSCAGKYILFYICTYFTKGQRHKIFGSLFFTKQLPPTSECWWFVIFELVRKIARLFEVFSICHSVSMPPATNIQ